MSSITKKFRLSKKITTFFLLAQALQTSASSTTMTHRVMGTSPLLYKMMDYSKQQQCFEVAPIFSSMYDASHVTSNIILNGKTSLVFDQQGTGDLNPAWLNLMANNTSADYYSTVTFTPSMTESGALLHWYDQLDNNMFFDVKTALVQCKSQIAISESGGGNGLNSGIANAQQAFMQSDWNYGKIGQANHVVGLDNIELRVGKAVHCTSEFSSYNMLVAAYGLLEAPTGTGTKAEWLFEPQVGTNHWGIGFGFEALVSGDDDLKFMIAGNYRYLTPAWETRSFDLQGNGQWSRYLSVQDTYGLPTAPATLGLPGINFFTQQAYINGRSELNLYTRLQKVCKSCYFEVAYNFFCIQRETIGDIKSPTSGYGIYALTGPAGGAGGVTTSHAATINQDVTSLDTIGSPQIFSSANFDKLSAAAATYASNTVTARLEIHHNNIIYGFGASIESALSTSAMSTWSVWAQFGFLFDNMSSCEDYHEFAPELYDFAPEANNFVYHQVVMDEAQMPQDVIDAVEPQFMADMDDINFEFSDNDLVMNELELQRNEIDELKENVTASLAQFNELLQQQEEQAAFDEQNNSADNYNQEQDLQDDSNIDEQDACDMIMDNLYDADDAIDFADQDFDAEQDAENYVDSDDQTQESSNNFENDTVTLDDQDIIPQAEIGIDLMDDFAAYRNQSQPENLVAMQAETIPLDNNEVIPQLEEGLPLANDNQADNDAQKENLLIDSHAPINHHEAQPMSDEQIALFNAHYKQQAQNKPMSEMDMLNQLDSTK